MGNPVATLPPPQFLTDSDGLDPNAVLADMIAEFEQISGRTLYPAQVERLLVSLYAYRESLLRNAIQYAGQQNLLAFAVYPLLDYIGQAMDTPRLGAVGALTTLQFVLTAAQTQSYTISAGTQVGTQDGQFVFITLADLTISAGATSGQVSAQCTTPGTAGNGYVPGQVSVLVVANPLISSVSNTSTTADGTDAEEDDAYRERIQLAPNQFSTAGPTGAYEYFARSASTAVIDANVVSPAPGQVAVYILAGPITAQPAASPNTTGIASAALISTVQSALSSTTVRPLCDTVTVYAVTEVDYTITATVTLYADADQTSTEAAASTAAADLALILASRIQRNLVPSQWEAALSVAGVYDVDISIAATVTGGSAITPQADGSIVLATGQWANCTALNITFEIGTEYS
jgi:phage-related baseplate assembly protein